MVLMRCENPIRSCGVVEHVAEEHSYYYTCMICGWFADKIYD